MAKKTNFSNISKAYVQGVTNNLQKYKDGITSVNTSPGQLAAQQSSKWLANLSASQGKWETSMNNLSLQSWQNATLAKSSRLATGAQAAAPKIDAYYSKNGAALQSIYDQVRAERGSTTGKQRSSDFQDLMKQLAGKPIQ